MLPFQISVLGSRQACVSLKITAHIRLVGKMEQLGYFLNRVIGGLEEDFYFQDDTLIYNLFGRLVRIAVAANHPQIGKRNA